MVFTKTPVPPLGSPEVYGAGADFLGGLEVSGDLPRAHRAVLFFECHLPDGSVAPRFELELVNKYGLACHEPDE